MPERIVGLYGYDFTRPFTVAGISFTPFYKHPEAERLAGDREAFHMTGYGEFLSPASNSNDDSDLMHIVDAGMTFLEQQQVVSSVLVNISAGDTVSSVTAMPEFRKPVVATNDRHAFGDRVLSDTWSPASRTRFLETFVARFRVEQQNDPLRLAFFRCIEISRLATPYVEIHHFLAFSALELLTRSLGPYQNQKNAAVPISEQLSARGFAVTQAEVERWTHARNKAFHEGLMVSPDPAGGPDIRLFDQLIPITTVLGDFLLRLLPFDDKHLNWNRWRDGMN